VTGEADPQLLTISQWIYVKSTKWSLSKFFLEVSKFSTPVLSQ